MISLPNNLVSIGAEAFRDCEQLKGPLILPRTVQEIGAAAFAGTHIGEETITEESEENG